MRTPREEQVWASAFGSAFAWVSVFSGATPLADRAARAESVAAGALLALGLIREEPDRCAGCGNMLTPSDSPWVTTSDGLEWHRSCHPPTRSLAVREDPL